MDGDLLLVVGILGLELVGGEGGGVTVGGTVREWVEETVTSGGGVILVKGSVTLVEG